MWALRMALLNLQREPLQKCAILSAKATKWQFISVCYRHNYRKSFNKNSYCILYDPSTLLLASPDGGSSSASLPHRLAYLVRRHCQGDKSPMVVAWLSTTVAGHSFGICPVAHLTSYPFIVGGFFKHLGIDTNRFIADTGHSGKTSVADRFGVDFRLLPACRSSCGSGICAIARRKRPDCKQNSHRIGSIVCSGIFPHKRSIRVRRADS